ncbi:hypothetical protein [Capnocytophaga leadbetteri]|uniref:hypothetical protein n=1 Tax=Capnocytophaga leadbetteri TaxID=327575 RepID=UPI0026F2E4BA|nr:hypothetical protein [Capnocytophaga leadbetteri]
MKTILIWLLAITTLQAQNIKQQLNQIRQQKKYERELREKEAKEKLRLKKAELSFYDLIHLQSKDLHYVDEFLTKRGFKLYNTNVREDDENNEEEVLDYKRVTWSFDKNPYNDLAKSWFNFFSYPDMDNAISYQITDEELLQKIKDEIIKAGYEQVSPTDAIARGLESTFRNDTYQVNFTKQLKKRNEEGADIRYIFFIFNYKEIEKRKAEQERITKIKAENKAKYDAAITKAETALKHQQYSVAQQAYSEAFAIYPEEEANFTNQIAEANIGVLSDEAEKNFAAHNYKTAIEKYTAALAITPNKNTNIINQRIKEITTLQQFLKDRTTTYYDYKEIKTADYKGIDEQLKNIIKEEVYSDGKDIPEARLLITAHIDTLGQLTTQYTIYPKDTKMHLLADKLTKSIALKPCTIIGYTVGAKAEFNYNFSFQYHTVNFKRYYWGNTSKDANFPKYEEVLLKQLSDEAPRGRYFFDVNETKINGEATYQNKLTNITQTRGASNALLSLLIPGLGDHRVSYGEVSGWDRALYTYGLIGAGVALKVNANNLNDKYLKATDKTEKDKFKQDKNITDLISTGCFIAGGAVWLYDIIWVTIKGAQNTSRANKYLKSFNTYYNPDLKAGGLSYTVNF